MLWTLILALFVLWLVGLIGGIASGAIHLLLALALVVVVVQILTGRRTGL